MVNQQQAYLPVAWLGTYTFKTMPENVQFDQETSLFSHPVIGAHEATEPTGYTPKKLAINGFFQSTDNQAELDAGLWMNDVAGPPPTATDGYKNRPCAVGFFSQDAVSVSQAPWFSSVGYLTTMHFEYQGGYAQYMYPYRFNWVEAWPLTRFATTTPIVNGTTTYSFTVTTKCSGYLAGVELIGALIQASGLVQSISSVNSPGPIVVGSGPVLGVGAQRLFSGIPSGIIAGGGTGVNPPSPTMFWPLSDNNNHQSIKLTAPISSQVYTVVFAHGFQTFLPSQINLIFVAI